MTARPAVVEALREAEAEAYAIALYLLRDERLAVRAATEALVRLSRNPRWAGLPGNERRAAMKRETMKAALAEERRKRATS